LTKVNEDDDKHTILNSLKDGKISLMTEVLENTHQEDGAELSFLQKRRELRSIAAITAGFLALGILAESASEKFAEPKAASNPPENVFAQERSILRQAGATILCMAGTTRLPEGHSYLNDRVLVQVNAIGIPSADLITISALVDKPVSATNTVGIEVHKFNQDGTDDDMLTLAPVEPMAPISKNNQLVSYVGPVEDANLRVPVVAASLDPSKQLSNAKKLLQTVKATAKMHVLNQRHPFNGNQTEAC
jgi:hypothetical protein